MVSNIVAFDNEDTKLGEFFCLCANMVAKEIKNVGAGLWEHFEMNSRSLNEVHLQMRAEQINHAYVFSSFTHGSSTALYCGNMPFIQSSASVNLLANTFSYCFACYSGQTLGPYLVENGTLCFLGYTKAAAIVTTHQEVFANCAVDGLLAFYNGATTSECFQSKRLKYNSEIDDLYQKNYFVASVLMDNRDCLVLHGNGELKVDAFKQST
jgi:hypothetical protein